MKIKINNINHKFNLRLPTILIKYILKKVIVIEDNKSKKIVKSVYKELINYKRKNGSFVLLEFESSTGEKGKIII